MAKKKVVKKVAKKKTVLDKMIDEAVDELVEELEKPELGEPTTSAAFKNLWQAIADIHHRIDCIVAAIEKSKSVKGL